MSKKSLINRIFKIGLYVLSSILLLLILLILFIRSPWGQDIIISKATTYVSSKTHTTVEVEKLYITFSGNILVEKLFLDDPKGDTLIYSERLEASIALLPLIFDQDIYVDFLEWEGLKANILRAENSETFNYNFLIDAFASPTNDTATSSSPPPKLDIGQIHLSNIALVYNDAWLGMESNLTLHNLTFEAKEIDLKTMFFEIETLKIEGAYLNYKQTLPQQEKTDLNEDTPLPSFKIEELSLNDIHVNYQSVPAKINSHFELGLLAITNTSLDLNQQKLQSEYFELNKSTIAIQSFSQEVKDSTSSEPFEWPQWEIDLQEISLSDNNFKLKTSNQRNYTDSFNLENMAFRNIQLKAKDIHYRPEDLAASFSSFSFREQSKFKLNNLAFNLKVKNEQIAVSGLKISTPNNKVEGDIYLMFKSFQELLKNPTSTKIIADLPSFSLNPTELYYFIPQLKKDTLLAALSKNNLRGELEIKGSLTDFSIPKIELQWGNSTKISASGDVKELLDSTKLNFRLNNFSLNTSKQDILHFIDQDKIGIKVPKQIQLTGSASGAKDSLTAIASLIMPEGKIDVKGKLNTKNQLSFEGKLVSKKLNLGKLLDNSQLGLVTLNLETKGSGENLNTLNAEFSSKIESFYFKNYNYSDIQLAGTVINGQGSLEASFHDYNLNTTLTSTFKLDTLNPVIDAELDVIGADLYALGLTEKKMKSKFEMSIHFEKNNNNLDLLANINEGIVVYDGESYALGNFVVDAKSNPTSATAKITSNFLNMEMTANASHTKLIDALKTQITTYFVKEKKQLATDSIQMNLNLSLTEAPIITKVLAEDLQFETIQLSLDFNQNSHQLTAALNSPSIEYQANKIDSILFTANGDKENLFFSFSFSNFNSGPINIPQTKLTGKSNDSIVFLDFVVLADSGKLMQVRSEIQWNDSNLTYHINPEELILNKSPWNILPNNELQFSKNKIIAKAFELKRNGQQVNIKTSKGKNNKETIELIFDNFNLITLTNFLNPNEPMFTGILKGNITIEDPTKDMGLVSKLEINDFKVLDILLGKLQLNAIAQQKERYKIDLSVVGEDVDLAINGNYTIRNTEGLLDFDVALNRLNVNGFEKITSTYVSNLKGLISANATIGGTIKNPEYSGKINFKENSFTISELSAPFQLNNESITFTTDEIMFNDFLVKDSENNKFHIDGKVLTENMVNPAFDLTIKATQFQVLNSTVKDNELFYGTVNLSTDLSIKGDLNVPVIRGQLSINENSDFTYVVPEEKLELKEREGVLIFVNKKNPDAILTRQDEDESSSDVIKGFDLNTTLKVNKNVAFNIIVDQRSGDNLKISGEGDFVLGLEPNGNTTLSGRYEVTDGYYEASLYNIVKRRFEITNGSNIQWRGNPLDAEMDIRAIYKIETSASSLMASKTSGQGIGIANEYNQKLPFLVYLNFDGELLKPEISFQLDMPESSQGELGGQVYARVQQLNKQEDELNKQVFSLLVLNQFFPTTSNDGTSGGSAALARGNVNKVLEDQLNNFSGKYLKNTGVELDFGVDSYTDYQGDNPQNKTQLDVNARKKLFNDKLIVQVGSEVSIEENSSANQQSSPVVGNVSLEYLITEDGRWRVKGFRKNEFESVIDGQLIITGIALIFQREFNQFSELMEELRLNKKNRAEQEK